MELNSIDLNFSHVILFPGRSEKPHYGSSIYATRQAEVMISRRVSYHVMTCDTISRDYVGLRKRGWMKRICKQEDIILNT